MARTTVKQRFWAKVALPDENGCMNWLASGTGTGPRGGYGQFHVYGRRLGAHRFAYELIHGPIPEGLFVDHRCWNHACVNIEHLRLATVSQNGENCRGAYSTSATGMRGVSWHKRTGTWQVSAISRGVRHWGGRHKSLDEAEEAAIALRNRLYTHNDADREGGRDR